MSRTKTPVQKHRTPHPALVVKRGMSGLGLFTTEAIPKGTFLIEYFGEIVSQEESDRRGGKYLFEVEDDKVIVGSTRANIARYINHSCRPNSEAETDGLRLYISAKRALKAGEELAYDYGKEYWNEHIKPVGCRCDKCAEKKKK